MGEESHGNSAAMLAESQIKRVQSMTRSVERERIGCWSLLFLLSYPSASGWWELQGGPGLLATTTATAAVFLLLVLCACGAPAATAATAGGGGGGGEQYLYKDPRQPLNRRIGDLLRRMTLAEKIVQMSQIERENATADVVRGYFVGSVLSGGGSVPAPQAPAEA
ncbi:hypothetical protein C2845_PM07G03690 [Panicum miliaceum]|uniref:Glycoside hydrolase family 3 N-terminal domain-containing protein n=1 Tax=Panicum miliaceum TaxID=4540 RepID=A0A3L6SK36_PANMI|nr:hypothetical protein C2845_PM07G03690 [Panicum miliaceum]